MIENPHTTYTPPLSLEATIRVRNQKILSMILALGLSKEAAILDFGCGRGDMLHLLREETAFKRVYGMDIDPFLVQRSAAYGNVKQGSFKELVQLFPPKSFDLIICSHVLEHCENPFESLRILKNMSSGLLLLAVPNSHSIGTILKAMLGKIPEVNLGHLQVWDIGHFNNLLRRARLNPIRWETDKVSVFPHRTLERKGGQRSAAISLKILKFLEVAFLPKFLRSFGLSIVALCEKTR